MGSYQIRANIHFGSGMIQQTGALCCGLGKKACIVSDPFFRDSTVLQNLHKSLYMQQIDSVDFFDFRSDPDCTDVDACVEFIHLMKCDFLIAIGGGSSIDTAKAAALVATNGGMCWDYCNQILPDVTHCIPKQPILDALPIVAIPTTAGTGSEANMGCVISNRALSVKSGIAHPSIYPALAIVDPSLMLDLPPFQTACTGFDAFSHAFESYMLNTTTYFSEAVALQSIRLFSDGYLVAVQDGKNIKGRSQMANASTLAGMCIALTDTSVGHVLGQPMSALFHMVHGATLAVTLDSIVEWILPNAIDKIARVALLLDPSVCGLSTEKQAYRLPEILRNIKKQAKIDQKLGHYGIEKADISTILDYVENNVGFSSPILTQYAKAPDRNDLERILLKSL